LSQNKSTPVHRFERARQIRRHRREIPRHAVGGEFREDRGASLLCQCQTAWLIPEERFLRIGQSPAKNSNYLEI
jgi:hypothetical protein